MKRCYVEEVWEGDAGLWYGMVVIDGDTACCGTMPRDVGMERCSELEVRDGGVS